MYLCSRRALMRKTPYINFDLPKCHMYTILDFEVQSTKPKSIEKKFAACQDNEYYVKDINSVWWLKRANRIWMAWKITCWTLQTKRSAFVRVFDKWQIISLVDYTFKKYTGSVYQFPNAWLRMDVLVLIISLIAWHVFIQ